MRLDARQGDKDWRVFDVPTCREIMAAVWVDDESAKYAFWPDECAIQPVVKQARRIAIMTHSRWVLIDPVDDEEFESVADVIAAARAVTTVRSLVAGPSAIRAACAVDSPVMGGADRRAQHQAFS